MKLKADQRIDHVAWVRRVNGRWIVRQGLNHSLSAYMDHLGEIDLLRLALSGRLTHRLVHSIEPAEDPKPWFYGGMFSLATKAEAQTFLAEHPLICSIVPSIQSEEHSPEFRKIISEDTSGKIVRLRETIGRLAKSMR
jgi:hypothetical protein